jgi:hypothetical protein
MKRLLLLFIVLLVISSTVTASIIPASLTEQKCGNGKREGYELCEPNTAFDLCPAIGKILKIAMVCNENTCACLPGESAKNCGNGIRESAEACDPGTGKKGPQLDICQNISQIIGLPLKCDPQVCDCVASGIPVVLSECGDDEIEGAEDCEADADCPKGRTCQNCTCAHVEEELNLSPVVYNVSSNVTLPPTIEEITSKAGKAKVLGFVLEDYIGEVLPEDLSYFDGETIAVHVSNLDKTNTTVTVITEKNVVQDIKPNAPKKETLNIWISEDAVEKIKAAEGKRTRTIVSMLEDGKITYRPRGFWRRLWFFFFKPF